jgi:hypothetical protein
MQLFPFRSELLKSAIEQTFKQRDTEISELSILNDPQLVDFVGESNWQGFLKRTHLESTENLNSIIKAISKFILPLYTGTVTETNWDTTRLLWA